MVQVCGCESELKILDLWASDNACWEKVYKAIPQNLAYYKWASIAIDSSSCCDGITISILFQCASSDSK